MRFRSTSPKRKSAPESIIPSPSIYKKRTVGSVSKAASFPSPSVVPRTSFPYQCFLGLGRSNRAKSHGRQWRSLSPSRRASLLRRHSRFRLIRTEALSGVGDRMNSESANVMDTGLRHVAATFRGREARIDPESELTVASFLRASYPPDTFL